MEHEREEICQNCTWTPSFRHPGYPCCAQPCGPINEEEYKTIGARPEDKPTRETIMKLAEISIKSYCLKKMIAGGRFDGC